MGSQVIHHSAYCRSLGGWGACGGKGQGVGGGGEGGRGVRRDLQGSRISLGSPGREMGGEHAGTLLRSRCRQRDHMVQV